jgi:hypothetical protein
MKATSLRAFVLPSALALLVGCGQAPPTTPEPAAANDEPVPPAPRPGKGKRPKVFEYDAVRVNPDLAIPEGFRGAVHPELAAEAELALEARWRPTLPEAKRTGLKLGIIDNAESPEYAIPDELVRLLTESGPAVPRATHGAEALSTLLPASLEGAGQMWKIDLDAAARFLQQIHPATAMTFDRYRQPYGRRPGPAGAFGILRAATDEWLDVVFRIHGEFILKEGAIVYTPACFLGRMLVDRRADRVAWLEMRVPGDLSVNLNILVTFFLPGDPRKEVTNIVFERVETMELVGGEREALARVPAEGALPLQEAELRLKKAFYKFFDIEWVPIEESVATATRLRRPILAAVLTSPLDDQSC